MKKIVTSVAPALLLLGVATLAFATTEQVAPVGPTTVQELLNVLDKVVNLVFTGLIILSVFFIIFAAFQFVTAGGDPAAIVQARQKLIWAAVGIIVALIARALPVVIRSATGL
ncbi:MAG: hypothetical protein HY603_01055 [Parcubacteria group bacterium]|nr:hypothetical protein [Parcubacteria group bacterium]